MPTDPPNAKTRILLLRHAQTAAPTRFHGAESDVGLSDLGLRQSQAAALFLGTFSPVAIYSSTMRRAQETARPIASAIGLELQLIPELHERRMGPLSGGLIDEHLPKIEAARQKWIAGELDATHEGGESFRQMRERVCPALTWIASRHLGQTSVVVAHGMVIRVALTCLLEGYSIADFDRIGIEHVAVNHLSVHQGIWRAQSLGQSIPLDD